MLITNVGSYSFGVQEHVIIYVNIIMTYESHVTNV